MSAKKKRAGGVRPAPQRGAGSAPVSTPSAGPDPGPMPTAGEWLEAWAFGPIAALRPYLAQRVVLWLVAVDVWTTHLGASWRYGSAGFNVAHFAWMDTALPVPTATAYVGMLALVSVGAAVAAFSSEPPRLLLVAIALLYFWGWSSSMHDSYQHHYLLSWVLLVLAAFPQRSAASILGGPARHARSSSRSWLTTMGLASLPHGLVPTTHAWGFRLLTGLVSVVYGYTAWSKLEPEWRSGEALRSMTHEGEGIEGMLDMLRGAGVEGDSVWPLLGGATIAIQVVVSLSYLLAPLADQGGDQAESDSTDEVHARRVAAVAGAALTCSFPLGVLALALDHRVLLGAPALVAFALGAFALRAVRGAAWRTLVAGLVRGLCLVGCIAAIAFHLGAEDMGLEIGWFSYYMIGLALIVLLPAEVLTHVAGVVTALPREIDHALAARPAHPVLAVGAGVAALVALAALGDFARAPGAFAATALCGVVLLALGTATLVRPALRRAASEAAVGALVLCALAALSLAETQERFDYFRFAGGDFRRRNDVPAALRAYREALPLAPSDDERERIAGRIEELESL